MKALEFDSQLANHDQIRVPAEVADQIPEGSVLRVILLPGRGEDEGWGQLSLDGFAAAYSEEDAVYEKLESAPRFKFRARVEPGKRSRVGGRAPIPGEHNPSGGTDTRGGDERLPKDEDGIGRSRTFPGNSLKRCGQP